MGMNAVVGHCGQGDQRGVGSGDVVWPVVSW